MKKQKMTGTALAGLRTVLGIVIMVLSLANVRAVVPAGYVAVYMSGLLWENAGCPPTNTSVVDPTNYQTLTKCDPVSASVYGAAWIYTDCQTGAGYTKCDVTVTMTGVKETGTKVDTTTDGCTKSYIFHDPESSGVITITATLDGDCYPNGCTSAVPQTWTSTGVINVDTSGSCSGSCDSSNPSLGSGDLNNTEDYGAQFRLNLGLASPQRNAGHLMLRASAPSTLLASPAAISNFFSRPNVEVLRDGSGAIKQVHTPQGLVNVSVKDAYEYHLECFYLTNVTAKSGGFYGTNGSAFVTWVVQNPDGATTSNRLWITEQRGSTTRQFQFSNNAVNCRWEL